MILNPSCFASSSAGGETTADSTTPSSLQTPFCTPRPAGKKLMLTLVTEKRFLSAASASYGPITMVVTTNDVIKSTSVVPRTAWSKEQRAKGKGNDTKFLSFRY